MSLVATALAVAVLSLVAADAAFARVNRLPDAEILASSTTAVITDPTDPRLDERLLGFKRTVTRIIRRGGGRPRRSQLVDGVFFSSILRLTTFQRSRDFDVDSVSRRELHDIADRIRRRFSQQSVLTFDYRERRRDPVDAARLEVPGVTARRLREGFAADADARARLRGGSVTLNGRLVLVTDLGDVAVAKRFARKIGGDLRRAKIRRGKREFVG